MITLNPDYCSFVSSDDEENVERAVDWSVRGLVHTGAIHIFIDGVEYDWVFRADTVRGYADVYQQPRILLGERVLLNRLFGNIEIKLENDSSKLPHPN